MNIHEISEKYKISLVKLRRMHKAGILVCSNSDGHPLAAAMRANLVRGQALSVVQLFALIEAPDTFAELRTRQSEARQQVANLGDYEADKPAPGILASFVDASENDSAAVKVCVRWLKGILPIEPVEHAWIAVRVAQGISDPVTREDFLLRFARAMHFIRGSADFAGWFADRKIGALKRKIYFRPAAKPFDL